MAPLKPHWEQPSHPEIQEVIINEHDFTSKSLSRVSLPPFGLYAKMAFPTCTLADKPTYATVQVGRNKHLNLNSDLLYINHSCEPSLKQYHGFHEVYAYLTQIFDTSNLNIVAGPNGLQTGEELTFFYPSTEWDMDQPFDCLCGKPTCRDQISGAKYMDSEKLKGHWINGHIRELLEHQTPAAKAAGDGRRPTENGGAPVDATAKALKDALKLAEKVVEAARIALNSYLESSLAGQLGPWNGAHAGIVSGAARHGPTSRELSGEMGGDTVTT